MIRLHQGNDQRVAELHHKRGMPSVNKSRLDDLMEYSKEVICKADGHEILAYGSPQVTRVAGYDPQGLKIKPF